MLQGLSIPDKYELECETRELNCKKKHSTKGHFRRAPLNVKRPSAILHCRLLERVVCNYMSLGMFKSNKALIRPFVEHFLPIDSLLKENKLFWSECDKVITLRFLFTRKIKLITDSACHIGSRHEFLIKDISIPTRW